MNEDNIDILSGEQNVDLSSVDTSFPVLKAGNYVYTVSDVQLKDNKAHTGKNLQIVMKLNQLALTIDDKEVQPGLPITTNISMVQTPKYDPRQNLARFQEAVLGTKGPLLPLEQYIGQDVTVVLKVRTDDEFGTRNEVQRFVKKG